MAKISNEVVKTVNRCGNIFYKLNGRLHREDGGPAVERANGDKEWWLNGQQVDKSQLFPTEAGMIPKNF
jgi:hypothetical protein